LLLDRRTVLSYCLPLSIAAGLMWLQSTSYRFWVGTVWGIADLGLVALGLSVAAQLWAIVETLFMQLLSPYFFRHIADRKTQSDKSSLLSDLVNVVWPIYAVLAGLNIYFASSLVAVLADDKYHGAVVFVMWGVLIEFFRCTANLWSYAAQIEGRTRKVILPYALGTLVLWSGLVLFCGRDGAVESLPAVLVGAGAVACLSMVIQMQIVLPVKLDARRWLLATLALGMCLSLSFLAPLRVDGLASNVGLLLLGLIIAAGALGSLLRRNSALARLRSVALQGD
jgi:O-antigen/teichoic acid export membrane protein